MDIVPEEIPSKEDTTYMLAAPEAVGGATAAMGTKEAIVVFCIDISGSMCVTTEVSRVWRRQQLSVFISFLPPSLPLSLPPSVQVPGKFELKGHDRVQRLSSLNVGREDQYMPRQRRDVTYVSRLQVRREFITMATPYGVCGYLQCCYGFLNFVIILSPPPPPPPPPSRPLPLVPSECSGGCGQPANHTPLPVRCPAHRLGYLWR